MATQTEAQATTKLDLLEYCITQRDKCQQIINENKGSPHYGIINKALMSAELSVGLLQVKEVDKTKARTQCLQKYMQSILDLTYYKESCLVDMDFPEATVLTDVQEIIDLFSNCIKVCGSNYKELIDILGQEVMECLHWRIGALMYMIAHTIMNNDSRRDTVNKEWLCECCYVGVSHLRKIFDVRTSLAADDSYTTNDSRLPKLLKHGIRSDSHMLALAYGGEMCYWYQLLNQQSTRPHHIRIYTELYKVMESIYYSNENPVLELVSVGVEFLELYIDVANSSLSMQSWQCERPQEVLLELKRMQKQ